MSEPTTFGPWTLSAAEQKRLDGYAKLFDLLTRDAAKHDQRYQRDRAEFLESASRGRLTTDKDLPQLYVNLPGLVARTAADLILSKPPVLKAEDPAVQARVDAIALRSHLSELAWRAIYWTAGLGDAFLTVADRAIDRAGTKSEPVVCLRRAVGSVARNIRPEDPAFARAYLFRSRVGDADLFAEYVAGAIHYAAFSVDKQGRTVPAALPPGYVSAVETRETVPLVVHVAALRGDDSDGGFGESDSAGTEDLVFEVSNRLRQVARVLDRHAEPAMNVPDGTLNDENKLDPRTAKVFERGLDGQGVAYVTWESQLKEAYAEIDRILKLLALITETPMALWGLDDSGQAESGRALKFRLLTGLGKARRSGMMLRSGLAEAVRLCLRREDVLAGRVPGDYAITVELSETFIADEVETADRIAKLRGAEAMSTRAAVALGQQLNGTELDEEVQRIREEKGGEAAPVGLEPGRILETGDAGPATDSLGKLPLAIQQLALARERAKSAGDEELSALLGAKINGLLAKIS